MTEPLTCSWLDADSVAELAPHCELTIWQGDPDNISRTCDQPALVAMWPRCVDCGAGALTLRCSGLHRPLDCRHCGAFGSVVIVVSEAL